MSRGPYFQGGPERSSAGMVDATAAFRDVGGLPPEGSLIFSQLLLNMGGHVGSETTLTMVAAFLAAADVPHSRKDA